MGYHASHNTTLKRNGLGAYGEPPIGRFVPVDRETAALQGKKDSVTGKSRGCDIPAAALFNAKKIKTGRRTIVISDANEECPGNAMSTVIDKTRTYYEFHVNAL